MVMFEQPRNFDRAYLAFPVSLEEGVVMVLDWALDRANDHWSGVNLIVPNRSVVSHTRVLQDMQRRGVQVSAERRSSANRATRGLVTVYHPSRSRCARSRGPGTSQPSPWSGRATTCDRGLPHIARSISAGR